MTLVDDAEQLFRKNPLKSRPKDVYFRHVELVRKYAVMLAKEYGADVEVVEVAALLHDIGADAGHVHAHKSAEIAKKFLKEKGLAVERVSKICEAISLHSCNKKEPDFQEDVDPESQMVRDGDGISFLEDGFKTYAEKKIAKLGVDEGKKVSLKKIKASLDKVKTEKGRKIAEDFYGKAEKEIEAL